MLTLDQESMYYKSIDLESVNNRRKDRKLEPLDKLGGFSYEEMLKLRIIDATFSGWANDGYQYRYYEPTYSYDKD